MKLFERQPQHLLALLALIAGLALLSRQPRVLEGELLGIGTPVWFWLAIAVPVLHQVYVAIMWRLELHHQALTHRLGPQAFTVYAFWFSLLFVGRLVTLILLALANQGTFALDALWRVVLIVVLTVPAVYTLYSVVRYFSMERAYGIDHFDPAVRKLPLVREGIFKYTPNAMYIFGLFVLWLPGLIWASQAALIVALFNHIYIWVHYLFTEAPDMREIYGESAAE